MRIAGAVLAGLVAWIAVATLVNLAMRATWADYAAVEKAMTFTLPMTIARLVLGAAASFGAGAAAAWIARGGGVAYRRSRKGT